MLYIITVFWRAEYTARLGTSEKVLFIEEEYGENDTYQGAKGIL